MNSMTALWTAEGVQSRGCLRGFASIATLEHLIDEELSISSNRAGCSRLAMGTIASVGTPGGSLDSIPTKSRLVNT